MIIESGKASAGSGVDYMLDLDTDNLHSHPIAASLAEVQPMALE
jgi:hypothetical protein